MHKSGVARWIVLSLLMAVCLGTSALKGTEKTPGKRFEGAKAGQERSDNGLKMKLVWCPAGKFKMGSAANEYGHNEQETQVDVTLTRGFWIGKYEVTQREWLELMKKPVWKGKDKVKEGPNFPASYLNWYNASEFCKKLTETERQAKRLPADWEYVLPTEAQWEYACRAGTSTRFKYTNGDHSFGEIAWYAENAGNTKQEYAHQVGTKKANAWGLHDTLGNVYEWCRDLNSEKLPGGKDPINEKGFYRACRGGGFQVMPFVCRPANRLFNMPEYVAPDVGLRVALVRTGK
jgi:formylglycine-generating enzyme required for sulfatase activity